MIDSLWTWSAKWIPGWKKWMGEGTEDDRKNFGWRIGEALRVRVLWAWTILDVRIGHTGKDGIWRILDMRAPYRTRENFWNALLSVQIYLVRYVFHTTWALVLCFLALVPAILSVWFSWTLYLTLPPLASCFVWPKFLMVIRPIRGRFLLFATEAPLFDRGERHFKFSIMEPEGNEPKGYEEGSL